MMQNPPDVEKDKNVISIAERLKENPKTKVLTNYLVIGEGKREFKLPIVAPEIFAKLTPLLKEPLRRVGRSLFFTDPKGEISWLETANQFYAYLSRCGVVISWSEKGEGMVSKREFFESCRDLADSYKGVSYLPHYPPLDNYFYYGPVPDKAEGPLDCLVEYFKPASAADKVLLKAAFLTPFWGARGGARPAFVFKGPDEDKDKEGKGRGVGKTFLAEMIAELSGGYIDFSMSEQITDIKKRILTNDKARCFRIDNVKSRKVSKGDIESLITSRHISGHVMYRGEGSKENLYTSLFTFNASKLSKDLAQRVITVRLDRPQYGNRWTERVTGYLAAAKDAILGDVRRIYEDLPAGDFDGMRFSDWGREVLGRLTQDKTVFEQIAAAADEMDADNLENALAGKTQEAYEEIMRQLMSYRLVNYGTSNYPVPVGEAIDASEETIDFYISRPLVHRWIKEAFNLRFFSDPAIATYVEALKVPGLLWDGYKYAGTRCYTFSPNFLGRVLLTRPKILGAWMVVNTHREARDVYFVHRKGT